MFHKNSADSPRGGRVDDGAPSGSAQEQQIRAREQPTAQEQDHDKLQEQVEHRGHAVSDSNKKKKTRVGFLGPPGNFTHLVGRHLEYYPRLTKYTRLFCRTIKIVIALSTCLS
jgi:hypothetical protein